MAYSDVAPIPKRMTIIAGLSVVGLMAFGLALSYYKNILFDRQLVAMGQKNLEIKNEIFDKYAELQYLNSEQYKDKYAKENFGLLRSGEKVLLLGMPQDSPAPSPLNELSEEEKQAIYEENLRRIRILDHWRLYLFERDKLEELKEEL